MCHLKLLKTSLSKEARLAQHVPQKGVRNYYYDNCYSCNCHPHALQAQSQLHLHCLA